MTCGKIFHAGELALSMPKKIIQMYSITKDSKIYLKKYRWINSKITLGDIGTLDDREITRLLLNHHYNGIRFILQLIDRIGECAGRISENILNCNDPMNFSRYLSELYLFDYLYSRLGNCVESNTEETSDSTHDINVLFDDRLIKIEIYSPTESYSFQLFSTKLQSMLKNLKVDFGFDLKINSKSDSVNYTYRFPPFREVLEWLSKFEAKFIEWFLAAEENDSKVFESPLEGYLLNITINRKDKYVENRMIIWGGATYSTDLKLYFEFDDPERFLKTNIGMNIHNKLEKRQAGISKEDVLRVFIINFAHADSTDLSFLNSKKTQIILEKNIKYITSSIKPTPYDIVIVSEIGSQCGFTNPIVIDKDRMESFSIEFRLLGFDNPIKKIQRASKEEERQLFEEIMRYSERNS